MRDCTASYSASAYSSREIQPLRFGWNVTKSIARLLSRFQVTANSGQLMVCRSALNVVRPPPENWYKDEGGRNNCIEIEVQVCVCVCVSVCECMCVFIKLHITAQSGPDILAIRCHSH